jgi:hypothetical protein
MEPFIIPGWDVKQKKRMKKTKKGEDKLGLNCAKLSSSWSS